MTRVGPQRHRKKERDEVKGEERKLHNEWLNDLYSSINITRVINQFEKNESGGACSMYGGERRSL